MTAANIVAGGLTTSYSASSTSTTASVSVPVPSGARSLVATAFFGGQTYTATVGGTKSGSVTTYDGPSYGTLSTTGSLFSSSSTYGSTGATATNPAAATYTVTATRSGGGTYHGNVVIVVHVTNR